MSPCPECDERRRKFVEAFKAMAAWVKNPVGPPPPALPNTMTVQTKPIPNDQAKTGKS